jgi:hypothetical protein
MWATAGEPRESVVSLYRRAWAHADATIEALPLSAVGRVPWWLDDRAEVTLHRVLVHVLAETDRHVGHADIVRELIDGSAGLRAGNDNLPPGVDDSWWAGYRDRLDREARAGLGGGEPGVVVGHGPAVGEQLAVVVEQDDAVAQQAPALLGVAADDGREVARLARGVGAGRYVVTHGGSIRSVPTGVGSYVPCSSDYGSTILRPD